MRRRFHPEQPAGFAFTADNLEWAKQQTKNYPDGRQASAIIPILMRAQEQEGWLSRPAVETCADLLGIAHIRAFEVATFYSMFHLQPVGSVAHIQICGTTICMNCGAEELVNFCRKRIASQPGHLSTDGKFSWEEVECLGACCNAPMAQIGKDYFEDLTVTSLDKIIDEFAKGGLPEPGSQMGRFASEPSTGLTTLIDWQSDNVTKNAAVALALEKGDTTRRIDGTK